MSNVPKLRFKEFSGEWEEKVFKELFERITTKNKENNLNVLTISAQQGLINQEEYFNKSVSAKDLTGYYLLNKNDFAYNKSYSKGYPLGAIKRLRRYEKGVVSTLYICFRAKKDSVDFIEQYFNSGLMNKEIHKIAQEGARNHGLLNISVTEFFNDTKLILPSKREQETIASFLTSVDTRIEQLTKKESLLQDYKKGVMQKIFNQEIRFKDTNGNNFPIWKEKNLKDICDIKGGKRIPKGYSLQTSKNEYPYITVSDMNNGSVNLENIKYVPIEVIKQIKNYTISSSDIYISVAGTLGLVGIIPKELENANLTENANKLTNITCVQKYLYYYLHSDYLYKLIKNVQTNNAQPKLAIYALKTFNVKLPSKEEQEKITNFLSLIDKKIEVTKIELEKTKEFKKALLQQMFV